MSTDTNKRNSKELGALWMKESNSGTKFYSGRLNIDGKEIQIVAFKNTKKDPNSKQPDWRIYESEPYGGATKTETKAPTPKAEPAKSATPTPRPAAPRGPTPQQVAGTPKNEHPL